MEPYSGVNISLDRPDNLPVTDNNLKRPVGTPYFLNSKRNFECKCLTVLSKLNILMLNYFYAKRITLRH